jgi:hypothetical protein
MKAYGGVDIDPRVLDLDTSWVSVIIIRLAATIYLYYNYTYLCSSNKLYWRLRVFAEAIHG